MIVESIALKNYRNYQELHLQFDPGTNILYGENAQGKTNILEALYLSGTTKSHRGSKDRDLIRFEEGEAHIRTNLTKRESAYQIDIHLRKSKSKGIAINQIPIKKASDLFGLGNYVFFAPEDLNMIKNGPAGRRDFLDSVISQTDRMYLHCLLGYQKVLAQRNRLLKDCSFRPALEETLFAWDEQLCRYGREIIEKRKNFTEDFNKSVCPVHRSLSGDREELVLRYAPNVEETLFEQAIADSRSKDLALKSTTRGPHRDDLLFEINGRDIRNFGSQGQQRTAALSMKLAEIRILKELLQDTPVLLLDDVLSELDSGRQNYLLNHISDIQTILTCTGLDELIKNRFQMNKVFQVVEGTVVS